MRKINRKNMVIALALLLLIAGIFVATGGSLAWLTGHSGPLTNVFTAGRVTTEVHEDFNGTLKKDVKIKNTGNTTAFIRAMIVPAWLDAQGNIAGRSVSSSDYTASLNMTDWFKGSDGYYYYKYAVAATSLTTNLINTYSVTAATDGLHFELQVLGSGIQSIYPDAVQTAWPVVDVSTDGQSIGPKS